MTNKMTDKQKSLASILANSSDIMSDDKHRLSLIIDIMSDDKEQSMNGVHKAMEDYRFLLNERTCHNCEEKLLPDGYEKVEGVAGGWKGYLWFCLSCYEAGASDEYTKE